VIHNALSRWFGGSSPPGSSPGSLESCALWVLPRNSRGTLSSPHSNRALRGACPAHAIPVMELNRAVAFAMAFGPAAAVDGRFGRNVLTGTRETASACTNQDGVVHIAGTTGALGGVPVA
jgi:hypothetical protein